MVRKIILILGITLMAAAPSFAGGSDTHTDWNFDWNSNNTWDGYNFDWPNDWWNTEHDYKNNCPVAPEPVSSSLFLLGAGALGLRRFRRKKNS